MRRVRALRLSGARAGAAEAGSGREQGKEKEI